MESTTITVHADNHIHDGMKCAIRNLLSAAEEGRIVLFMEGNVHSSNLHENKKYKSHDIEWEGNSAFIHGIEPVAVSSSGIWANAARLAFNTGRSDSRRIREAGRDGVLAIRGVLVALSTLPRNEPCKLDVTDNDAADVQTFVGRLKSSIDSARRLEEWIERELYEIADRVAVDMGKWPAGDLTFKDLQTICTSVMHIYPDLQSHGSLTECMNHHHIYLRETDMANNIKNTLYSLQQSKLATPSTDVHLVIGAGHVAQLIDDHTLKALVLDKTSFWMQQEQLKGMPRLCDLLKCKLSSDPFSSDL